MTGNAQQLGRQKQGAVAAAMLLATLAAAATMFNVQAAKAAPCPAYCLTPVLR